MADDDQTNYREPGWLKRIPPKWRTRMYWAATIGTAIGAVIGPYTMHNFRVKAEESTEKAERSLQAMQMLGSDYGARFDMIDRDLLGIADQNERLSRELKALKLQMREIDDEWRQQRRMAFDEHEENAVNRHQQLLEELKKKRR